MNHTEHKNFAVNALKAISSDAYDEINASHEAKNAAIRSARADWENASPEEKEEKGVILDKLLGTHGRNLSEENFEACLKILGIEQK